MLHKLVGGFTKLTAWPVQALVFRTKVYYEDKAVQSRSIKGPAILISNHTSVFDVALMMFVFFSRTLRPLTAELIFQKPVLGPFMRLLGAVRVNRDAHDFSFLTAAEQILRCGGIVEIYPESRLPRPGEERPLPFTPSAAYLALSTGVPVIPVWTDGAYFSKKRARIIIGKPIDPSLVCDGTLSDRESIARLNAELRQKIIDLEALLIEQSSSEQA